MVRLRRKNENIYDYINLDNSINAIYGIGFANQILDMNLDVDYFIDRKAGIISKIRGVPVVSIADLVQISVKDKKHVTIVILTLPLFPPVTVHDIYNEVLKYNFDADIFDYWGNEYVFAQKTFIYKEKKYALFEHPYNCFYTHFRMTERSVEVPLMKEFVKNVVGEICEVGAVSPYYFHDDKIVEIIDPTDNHPAVTKRASLFELDLNKKNVMCVSTLEHIGSGEYGLEVGESAKEGLEKIIAECASCFITFPYGYNDELDVWVEEHANMPGMCVMARGLNNEWKEIKLSIQKPSVCCKPPIYAYGLVIITK